MPGTHLRQTFCLRHESSTRLRERAVVNERSSSEDNGLATASCARHDTNVVSWISIRLRKCVPGDGRLNTTKKMASYKGASPTKILRAVACMVVLLAMTASEGHGQVLAGPNGPVEFIGLQNWKAQELFDAIQELEPDRPFHACAAIMKLELGFADAACVPLFC